MPPLLALGGGMFAGAIGSCITMPFDVIKTRMQGMEAKKYNGTLHCVLTVVRSEGAAALFKGLPGTHAEALTNAVTSLTSHERRHV